MAEETRLKDIDDITAILGGDEAEFTLSKEMLLELIKKMGESRGDRLRDLIKKLKELDEKEGPKDLWWDKKPIPKKGFDPDKGPDPRFWKKPFLPKRFDPDKEPDRRYWEQPIPKRFDPDKGPDPRYLLAGGGIMDVNRMTAPLGYRTGGSTGTYELTKEDVDLLGMDPSIIESGENIISKDSDEYIKLMEIKPVGVIKGLAQDLFGGLGQLFGGRGAEGSEISPAEELKMLELQLMLEKGMPGSTLMPSGNPDKIKRLEDRIIEIYTQLGE